MSLIAITWPMALKLFQMEMFEWFIVIVHHVN